MYIPTIIPSSQTQRNFNEAISERFTLLNEPWTFDRKPVNTAQEFQLDIGSANNINALLYLKAAHQKTHQPDLANTHSNIRFNNAIFHVFVKKIYNGIDRIRYPKNPIMTDYRENFYSNQYRDLKLFYDEYVGEELLFPIKTYKMETYHPIQINDLWFQVDYITPERIRLFEEYDETPTHTDLYVTLIEQREIKMISGENTISGVDVT